MVNRGKQFEDIIKDNFNKIPNVNVVRLHDQTTGFSGSKNPCDFLIYKEPILLAIECKTVHGNTLPFNNITDFQYQELIKMGEVDGVVAGVICWWVDRDRTRFIPISTVEILKDKGNKSIRYDYDDSSLLTNLKIVDIKGVKKRVFFEYNMKEFLYDVREYG